MALWMAKGDWENPEVFRAHTPEEEADARAKGFVNGHEFYSRKTNVIEAEPEVPEVPEPVEYVHPRRKGKR